MSTDAADNFASHFETLKLDDETLKLDHGETIVPPDATALFAEPIDKLQSLPRIAIEGAHGTVPDLRVIGTLGEGGMGLVRLAKQLALEREVAVKTLRSGGDEDAPKLLQEAYVTGRLEHPNIVPVYTLGRDDGGAPLIVMKRIDGVSWLEIMRNPSSAPQGQEPDLLWHLDVLLQVCNALRYAHSHDVIHRDIKPENVMLGQFGEVYLLDWGIAVSIAADESASGSLPHRDDISGVCGTPAYMAPELTNDDSSAHDVRTDVYLLGATLHEILTGSARHDGANLFDVMRSAYESKPVVYPEDVPSELAAIANRAMARDPADRFQSVNEFRQALLDYVDHRSSHELADEAAALLDQVTAVRAESPNGDDVLTEVDEQAELRIHDLLIQCRFACQQALRAWPENPAATGVHAQFLEVSFRHALDRGDLVGARSALTSMESAAGEQPELREELEALTTERETEAAEFAGLKQLAAEFDLRRGRVSRSVATLVMGLFWSLTVIWTWWRFRSGELDDLMQNHLDATWRTIGIGVVALILFRKPFMSTASNRRFAALILTVLIAIGAFRAVCFNYPEIGIGPARSFEIALYGVLSTTLGLIADDLRIILLAIVYFVIAVLEPWVGDYQLLVTAIHHLVFFGAVAWFWTPRQIGKRWKV